MRKSFLILLISLISFPVFSQKKYRPIERYGDKVNIDSITPVIDLVNKLEEPWEFVQTGKSYWIGYTDNMYSIAFHGQKAINILVSFIDTSKSLKGRIGALYTLHLIGIKGHVAGRFIEVFADTLARKAIISFLDVPDLHETVVYLLMRDPWVTDIPCFMEYLAEMNKDYSKILSALQRYDFENKPFGQILPERITLREIEIKTIEPYTREPIEDMIALQKALGDSILIDKEILSSPEWLEGREALISGPVISESQRIGTLIETLSNATISYCNFSNRFFYIYRDKIIHIYGPKQAREIWLDWWSGLTDNQKINFKGNLIRD